jgi:hypothetical protein
LKDWTLGEVIYYCGNMGPLNCKKCHFGRPNGKCTLFKDIPSAWDLTDPPRFTEQEVEDAKTMIRMFPALNLIWRDNSGILEIRNEECTDGAIINPAMFPSIKSGETVELSDIIGGNND